MANTGHLFFSTDTDKQTLHRRITPSAEQQEMQQERWNDLAEYLKADLADITGYPIHTWLQGSYKLGTQTRPPDTFGEFDIDLGIYFSWPGNPNDGTYSPLALKTLVQESLERYAGEVGDGAIVISPPKTRCCRIQFSHGFHIDVPVYHYNADLDARALATQDDKWEASDPKAFYVWFREKFPEAEDSTQARRLIRYMKIWAGIRYEEASRPSSIMLTVLVAEAYLAMSEAECVGDDLALRNMLGKIILRMAGSSTVANPVDRGENLNRLDAAQCASLVSGFHGLLDIAERASAADTEFEAAAIWSEAFQQFFPMPVADSATSGNKAIVPVIFEPDIDIVATSQVNKDRPFIGRNAIGPIPRGCIIKFVLRNGSELPQGAEVSWTVRNEGEEAEFRNDLGHASGIAYMNAEHSAYMGKHYMDVLVRSQYGVVLGFRRVPVVISGVFMVARNPRKPGWTRIPRR